MISGYMGFTRAESQEVERICIKCGYRIEEFQTEPASPASVADAGIAQRIGVKRREESILREYARNDLTPWTIDFEKDLAAGEFGPPKA